MPVRRVQGGYQWHTGGEVYRTRRRALRRMSAKESTDSSGHEHSSSTGQFTKSHSESDHNSTVYHSPSGHKVMVSKSTVYKKQGHSIDPTKTKHVVTIDTSSPEDQETAKRVRTHSPWKEHKSFSVKGQDSHALHEKVKAHLKKHFGIDHEE